MTLDLNNWEARLVLEAMRSLEAQWIAVIDGTEDEDVPSEYGNDLAQLEMTRERIEAAACVEFGPEVRVFSREPVGVAPRGDRRRGVREGVAPPPTLGTVRLCRSGAPQ